MTRCKVGDLAIVIGAKHCKDNIGLIVEVLRPATNGGAIAGGRIQIKNPSDVGWVIRRAGGGKLQTWVAAGCWFYNEEAACLDSNLMPIRNPGEDAKDESVRWLPPVPTKEHA